MSLYQKVCLRITLTYDCLHIQNLRKWIYVLINLFLSEQRRLSEVPDSQLRVDIEDSTPAVKDLNKGQLKKFLSTKGSKSKVYNKINHSKCNYCHEFKQLNHLGYCIICGQGKKGCISCKLPKPLESFKNEELNCISCLEKKRNKNTRFALNNSAKKNNV